MALQPSNLRPLSAGEVLDRAFRLYRAHFWLFIGIAGILLAPFLALELLSLFIFGQTTIVSYIQSFFEANLLYGAMVWAASRAYLGLPVSMNDSYRQAQPRFGSFFGANFMQGAAYFPAIILVGLGALGGTGCVVIMALCAIPYLVFLSIRWGLVVPAIMIEGLAASPSLKRSWSLTAQDFKHIFVVLMASTILSYLVVLLPGTIIVYAMTQFEILKEIGLALSSVITQLGILLSVPLTTSILVIIYYDLRVRREGYDLELALGATTDEPAISGEQGLPNPEQ